MAKTSFHIISNLEKINRAVRKFIPSKHTALRLRQQFAGPNDQFPNVEWLSHHIPKTAGISLKYSLTQAFGESQIQSVYPGNPLLNTLNAGRPVWVPSTVKVIHGHFRPHINHNRQFPNARRIVWIRDPLERNISALNYWLRTQMHSESLELFKDANRDKSFEELFSIMMDDVHLLERTRKYAHFFGKFSKTDFAFVGHVETYNEDLKRLEDLMDVKLAKYTKNVKPDSLGHDIDITYYREVLQSEYELLEKWR